MPASIANISAGRVSTHTDASRSTLTSSSPLGAVDDAGRQQALICPSRHLPIKSKPLERRLLQLQGSRRLNESYALGGIGGTNSACTHKYQSRELN